MEAQRGAAQGYVTGDRGIWPGVCASGLAIYLVEPRVKWKCRVFCSKLLRIQDGKSRVLNQAWGPSKFPLPIEASPAVLRSWKARNSPPWVLSYPPWFPQIVMTKQLTSRRGYGDTITHQLPPNQLIGCVSGQDRQACGQQRPTSACT